MFGAEPWTEAMRTQLEAELGLKALNVYGLSEIVGPGVAAECPEARDGLHVQEDHFLVEVVDPETGAPRSRRHRRRARLHDADQGGAAAAALPHRRHREPDPRALRLRAHLRAHERGPRPPRRHADRPRRQPLPVARSSTSCSRQEGVAPHYQLVVERPAPARRGHRPLRAARRRRRHRSARRPRPRARSASGSASASRVEVLRAPARSPAARARPSASIDLRASASSLSRVERSGRLADDGRRRRSGRGGGGSPRA